MANKNQLTASPGSVAPHWHLAREAATLIIARVMILGPLERCKLVIQTQHMPKYANPVADKPRSIPDYFGSK